MPGQFPAPNRFEQVPLIPAEACPWPNIIEACDPLLQDLVIAGLSAVKAGLDQSANRRLFAIAHSQPLLDVDGDIRTPLAAELSRGEHPFSENNELIESGLQVAAAGVQVSRLFSSHPVDNHDYTGTSGLGLIIREATVHPASVEDEIAAGRALETDIVHTIGARLIREPLAAPPDAEHIDLALAAGYLSQLDQLSLFSTMHVVINRSAGTVRADVISGERSGNYVNPDTYNDFGSIARYTHILARILRQVQP